MVLLRTVGSQQSAVGSRKYLAIGLLLFVVSFISACASLPAPSKSTPEAAAGTAKVYQIKVEGMHCKTCVFRVTKGLKKLPQVREVEVSLEEETATVTLYEGTDVSEEELNEAIEDSGYKPNGITKVNSK